MLYYLQKALVQHWLRCRMGRRLAGISEAFTRRIGKNLDPLTLTLHPAIIPLLRVAKAILHPTLLPLLVAVIPTLLLVFAALLQVATATPPPATTPSSAVDRATPHQPTPTPRFVGVPPIRQVGSIRLWGEGLAIRLQVLGLQFLAVCQTLPQAVRQQFVEVIAILQIVLTVLLLAE